MEYKSYNKDNKQDNNVTNKNILGIPLIFIQNNYSPAFYIMQACVLLFTLIGLVVLYISFYKPSFLDPIVDLKSSFLNMQFIVICISLGLVITLSIILRNKTNALPILALTLVLNLLLFFILFGFKINCDFIYTPQKFISLYESLDLENPTVISTNLDGLTITSQKNLFLKENIKAYNLFTIKTVFFFALHFCVIVLNWYLILSEMKSKTLRDRLSKDDVILYGNDMNFKS